MRLPLLATLAAFIALALGLGFAGMPVVPAGADSPFRVLAGSSLLGRGILPALLFGGSFVAIPVALIIGGVLGMARNAAPRTPRAKRRLSRTKTAQTETKQLQTV